MQVLQMKRRLLSNIAIHLSRHRKAICLIQSSLRPGDGERYAGLPLLGFR